MISNWSLLEPGTTTLFAPWGSAGDATQLVIFDMGHPVPTVL